MTIDTFKSNYGIKQKKTVIKWISGNLIPGADLLNDYIPDSARPPYTKARAKDANAIYCSIVKAACERRHVLPQLYKICAAEFDGYINRLVEAKLIVARVTDNITYYDSTLKLKNCNKKVILELLESCSKGIAKGIAEAVLEHVSSM